MSGPLQVYLDAHYRRLDVLLRAAQDQGMDLAISDLRMEGDSRAGQRLTFDYILLKPGMPFPVCMHGQRWCVYHTSGDRG